MKKNYVTPIIEEEVIEIEDVVASSGPELGDLFGDTDHSYPWGK